MAKLYTSCDTRWASRSLHQGASKPSAWTFGARAAVLGHGGGHEAESLGTLCFIKFHELLFPTVSDRFHFSERLIGPIPFMEGWSSANPCKSWRCFFPTCQARVVRFYQSTLPPPHLPPPRPPPPRLAVLFLLVLLLASSFSFSSTMSASTSTCTSALPTLRQALCQLSSPTLCAKLFANFPAQCALLDLNLGAAQLSVHRWTSTGDLPSSVCAPLDLNRGPAQLSVHRWTSTGDLPSSVCTAGPQRPDRMPEDMPDRMPEDMPDRMPDGMPEDMPEHLPEDMPGRMPEAMPDRMPEDMSDRMPEDMPDRMPEGMPDRMSDRMPEGMSDRMPEDLPVTKCINVMVGITRSKVIFSVRPLRAHTAPNIASWPWHPIFPKNHRIPGAREIWYGDHIYIDRYHRML